MSFGEETACTRRLLLDSTLVRALACLPERVDAILQKTPDRADDWDSHWRTYSDVASSNPAQIMRHELLLAMLGAGEGREHSPHPKLLDIGCGQGDFLAR